MCRYIYIYSSRVYRVVVFFRSRSRAFIYLIKFLFTLELRAREPSYVCIPTSLVLCRIRDANKRDRKTRIAILAIYGYGSKCSWSYRKCSRVCFSDSAAACRILNSDTLSNSLCAIYALRLYMEVLLVSHSHACVDPVFICNLVHIYFSGKSLLASTHFNNVYTYSKCYFRRHTRRWFCKPPRRSPIWWKFNVYECIA